MDKKQNFKMIRINGGELYIRQLDVVELLRKIARSKDLTAEAVDEVADRVAEMELND